MIRSTRPSPAPSGASASPPLRVEEHLTEEDREAAHRMVADGIATREEVIDWFILACRFGYR